MVFFDGWIDEGKIFNDTKNASAILNLYNYGNISAPAPSPPTPGVNDSVESTAVVKQEGTVTLLGPLPATIASSNFNVSVNDTSLYGGYALDVSATNSNVVTCNLEIDGVVLASESRSNVAGVLGNLFIMFNFTSLDAGEHTQELICNRASGAGQIVISEAVGIGHFMIDEEGNVIPHNDSLFSASVSSGASFTLYDSFNLTVGNLSSDDQEHSIVIESRLSYENLAGSDELLTSYMTLETGLVGSGFLSPYAQAIYLFNWTVVDSSGNGNDGTLNGYTLNDGTINGATTGVTGVFGEAVSFDGVNDYINVVDDNSLDLTTKATWSFWAKQNSYLVNAGLIDKFDTAADQDNHSYTILTRATDELRLRLSGDGVAVVSSETTNNCGFSDTSWTHIAITYDAGSVEFFKNGISCQNLTSSVTSIFPGNSPLQLAHYQLNDVYWNGSFDEIRILNKVLTSTQIKAAMNSHYPVETPVASYSFESYNATDVFDTNWNVQGIDDNETGAVSFDGVDDYVNTPYTLPASDNWTISTWFKPEVSGSNFILGQYVAGDGGRFNVRTALDGGKNKINVQIGSTFTTRDSDDVAIGKWNHLVVMRNSTDITIYLNGTLIGTTDTLTANIYQGDTLELGRIALPSYFNGSLSDVRIFNTSLTQSQVETLFNRSVVTFCAQYPRYVYSGNVGSVSMDCILEGVQPNKQYNISLYGNGSNSVFDGVVVAKDFFMSDEEIIGGTGIFAGLSFNGSSDTLLFNGTGGNLRHASANAFNKVSYSIKTSVDTTVTMRVEIQNGNIFVSQNFTRDFEAGKTGVLIGHDSFVGVAQDNYSILLYANCGGAVCTIVGGQSLGYITDVTTTIFNSFNITAFNGWDNSSILSFNVSNGATFTTTNGSVTYFTTDDLVNFTVSSDGYLDTFFVNHNASNNVNASLNQSLINFDAFELITGNLLNANFSVSNGTTTLLIEDNVSLGLIPGDYNVTAIVPDYFVNMSFNGSYDYVSGSSATGSVLTSSLDLSSAELGDTVLVKYGYKSSVNADYVLYSSVYVIDSWSFVDTSLANARDFFDGYGFFEKALIGTLIAMFIAGLFIAGAGLSSLDLLLGASLGGIMGFGLAWYLGLFTTAVFVTVSFVFGLIIITNLRGKS